MEYVNDSGISWIGQTISNVKDAVLYFGWKSVLWGSDTQDEANDKNNGDNVNQ